MTDNFKPTGETAPADFLRSTGDGSAQEVGSDTLSVSDVVFGQAPSARLPFWKAAALESQANFAQSTPDGALFARQNNGPIKGGVENQTDEEKLDNLREGIAIVAAEEKRQRELWAQTQSTFAGVTMTGAEWSGLSAELSGDTELRRWMVGKFSKEGRTPKEAEDFTDKIVRLMKIQSKLDADRTDAERRELLDASNDPAVKAGIEAAQIKSHELAQTRSASADSIAKGDFKQSVATGADEFSGFQNAPDLSRDYNLATVTKAPIDNKPLPAIERAPSPRVIATGFDV